VYGWVVAERKADMVSGVGCAAFGVVMVEVERRDVVRDG
jgi:hypothetical protein